MRVQGWRASISSAGYFGSPAQVKHTAQKEKTGANSTENPLSVVSDASRQELLEKIRKRIQTGYYNSDAVIEDLGHGFAKALDHTL